MNWEKMVSEHVPVVLLLFTIGGLGLSRMAVVLIKQQEKLQKSEKETQSLEIKRLVEKIEHLVEQVTMLFKKHDNHGERLDRVENAQEAQRVQCLEREKFHMAQYKHLRENCLGRIAQSFINPSYKEDL